MPPCLVLTRRSHFTFSTVADVPTTVSSLSTVDCRCVLSLLLFAGTELLLHDRRKRALVRALVAC